MHSTFGLVLLVLSVGMTAGTQLLYPVEPLEGEFCGPYKECPPGTECMRTFDRTEPFSCFLPQFGSTFSFVEQKYAAKHACPSPTAPPTWLLAFASFGVLCFVAFVIWAGFWGTRRLLVRCVLPSIKGEKRTAEKPRSQWPTAENPGYDGSEEQPTASGKTAGVIV
ncbi:hypothetical protein M3Y99_00923200 [Aphelenchoides fujianensis]|nr:hypothetical protein M3Y99_00923200 [Aphelenchoides fujianensis]